ncbi:MAG: hypothetical protein ACYTAS_21130 [Planctomycetota bacterium]|jgi:hypothetical protein
MKRISIVIALAMLAPAMGGTGRYSSQRYRVRYSPYAFSYHNSGLIPGGVKYSPYAFQPGNSGLVYEGTRYTPYAFNYHNRGLVVDYYLWHTPMCSPGQAYSAGTTRHVGHAARPKRSRPATRRRPPRHAATSSQQTRPVRTADGTQIIRQYLKSRGIDEVDLSRRLSIRNKTAGIAFILPDRNLVIRYSDPETLESFAAESATSRKVLNRYEQRWKTFAKAFEARGGTIYRINTSDKSQIVAALDNCDRLAPGNATPHSTRLYAKD